MYRRRWGESAGAISVALQMLTNGGDPEGLFRGAFMQSGSPIPVGDITHGQQYYDALVDSTGCARAADTLQCLREVPFETLMNTINQTPNVFTLSRVSSQSTPEDLNALSLMLGPSHSTWSGCPGLTVHFSLTPLRPLLLRGVSQTYLL